MCDGNQQVYIWEGKKLGFPFGTRFFLESLSRKLSFLLVRGMYQKSLLKHMFSKNKTRNKKEEV